MPGTGALRQIEADYIVVGSGAGGGPLAANLAKAGYDVLLLEAGGDLCSNDAGRYMYEVPIFHALCSEDKSCSWNYFVHHYTDRSQAERDTKYDRERGGVWYPRAATLGGCTAHNAMITVTPQAIDWDLIARLTGDWSWRAENMYRYYARLENCFYVSRPNSLWYLLKGVLWSALALVNRRRDWRDWRHGHGFAGWLHTAEADPLLLLKDKVLTRLVLNAVRTVVQRRVGSLFARVLTRFDPNDLRNSEDSPEGLAFTPLAVAKGKRNGPREYVRAVEAMQPQRLHVMLETLVTKVLFDADKRAIGVEALRGPRLYKADPLYGTDTAGEKVVFRARREVILAAGAFNTPQILKLSGIGPAVELESFGIPVVVDLPGVGENLQDRYEVAIISHFPHRFKLLQGATFEPPIGTGADPVFTQWEGGNGLYTSNGSLLGIMKRSRPELPEPDLYIFGLPSFFRGYFQGYSTQTERYGDRFTWAILKAYTNNQAGRVTLTSGDPTDVPRIDFHYFEEGSDERGDDLAAVVEAMKFVRSMNEALGSDVADEQLPGPDYATEEQLRTWVRNEAWGHHASCTAPIGARSNPEAVLDSRFRVRGVRGLRVVDACIFPRIPGYFIASAIYMISEKAFDVICEDANKEPELVAEPSRLPHSGYDKSPQRDGA